MFDEFFGTAQPWSGSVIKLLSGKFAVMGNREITIYDTLREAKESLAELTGSTVVKLRGGKIYELIGGQFLAVSDYDSEPERFCSLEDAGQWLLQRMDAVTTKVFGGEVRKFPTGKFAAVSRHLADPTYHDTFESATAWLARQEDLSRNVGRAVATCKIEP